MMTLEYDAIENRLAKTIARLSFLDYISRSILRLHIILIKKMQRRKIKYNLDLKYQTSANVKGRRSK